MAANSNSRCSGRCGSAQASLVWFRKGSGRARAVTRCVDWPDRWFIGLIYIGRAARELLRTIKTARLLLRAYVLFSSQEFWNRRLSCALISIEMPAFCAIIRSSRGQFLKLNCLMYILLFFYLTFDNPPWNNTREKHEVSPEIKWKITGRFFKFTKILYNNSDAIT